MTRLGILLAFAAFSCADANYAANMETQVEDKAIKLHKVDATNLMIFVMLLILTVLTVWLFKHRRCKFLHETGVTLIYGLIVGLIIRLAVKTAPSDTVVVQPKDETAVMEGPPTYVKMRVGGLAEGENGTFHYKIMGRFFGDETEVEDSVIASQMTFSPEIFFNILLPPIIFHAGYSLKRKNFFRNIGTIMVFAFLGTTISCVVVGYIMYGIATAAGLTSVTVQEALFFGALISATDPVTMLAVFGDMGVDPDLFAICFGESALNDAVAIVLTQTIERYSPDPAHLATDVAFDLTGFVSAISIFFAIFFGSFFLGALVGIVTALITKFTKIKEFPLLESSLFLLMSYLSFLAAEACNMTGIVAVLFCGMVQAHYTYNNLSDESKGRTKQFFEVMNFLSESFIFTYIGVSLFTSHAHLFSTAFIFGAFFAIFIGRAIFIYPLGMLMNLRRKPKIPMKHLHMLLFSGLRGAIAFALAIRNTANHARMIIYTTTSLIVIFTVIFNGGFAQQMVVWLKIRYGLDSDNPQELSPADGNGPNFSRVSSDEPSASGAEEGGERRRSEGANPWDKALLPRKWYNFDARFMKPLLTHSRPNLMETMPTLCLPLARLLTSTEQIVERDINHRTADDENDLVFDAPSDPAAISNPNLSRSSSHGFGFDGDLGLDSALKESRSSEIRVDGLNPGRQL